MTSEPNWSVRYRAAMEKAAGRCQICRECQGSTGYYYGNQGSFRALAKTDQPIALQTLRDLKMEQVDLVTIKLSVQHFDGNMDNLNMDNLMVTCLRCNRLIVANRRSHKAG